MTDVRNLQILAGASVAALLAAAGMIFFYAPQDVLQGPVQRIFYVHVSSATTSFVCFGLVVGGGVAYLWRGSLRGDRLARAGASVGLVLITTTIALGIIWAKPVWGWDPTHPWDARFTTTVVLWMIYGAYLLVRKFAPPGRTAMRLAAIVGIFGFLDVPVVYESVNWWNTLHPGPVLEAPGGPALPPAMVVTFAVTLVCMLFFAGVLVAIRYRIEALRDSREDLAASHSLELAVD